MIFEFTRDLFDNVIKTVMDNLMVAWLILSGIFIKYILIFVLLSYVWLFLLSEYYYVIIGPVPSFMLYFIISSIIPALYFGIPYITKRREEFYSKKRKVKK